MIVSRLTGLCLYADIIGLIFNTQVAIGQGVLKLRIWFAGLFFLKELLIV